MEFKEYLAIIRRRWLLFFPIFALIVGAHLFWISYGQKSLFAANSKLIISEQPEIGNARNGMVPLGLPEVDPLTKEATITDYPVLRRAAELALGRVEFVSPEFLTDKMRSRIAEIRTQVASDFGNTEDGIEALIRSMQDSVDVQRPGNRQIVEIHVVGDRADSILLWSWAMAEAAHLYHREKARANIDEFLENTDKMIDESHSELNLAHKSLTEAQDQMGITNFAEKERMILENLYRIDREEDRLRADARKNERLIQHRLQQQSFGSRVDIGKDIDLESNGRIAEIRELLFQKKLDLDAKISTLSPKHPEVKQIRAMIVSLEKTVAKEQDSVLVDKYKQHSRETNALIKDNANINLEIEVLNESKKRLNDELQVLNSMRQDFVPKETRYKEAQERLAQLAALRKQMTWLSQGNLGGVAVYDPAVMVEPINAAGAGYGPLTLTLLMAFIFALGVVYIVEYVDTRVKSEHDVRRHLNLPLLGVIPREPGSGGLLTDCPPQSEISEKFNTAATLIQSTSQDLRLRTIMVCSAIAREGKTTVSVNLAVALARKGARVVLVDGDLRLSQVHNVLRLPNHVGVSNALDPAMNNPQQLIEGVMLDDELVTRDSGIQSKVQKTHIEGLDVLTSGPPSNDPVTLLDSTRLKKLVDDLKQHYDFVIFDTPPINKVGDALTISSVMDGCVFVVGCGQAEQHDVTWAKHLLANVQANVLGVFLNKFSKQRGSEYYYYYDNDRKRKRVRSRG